MNRVNRWVASRPGRESHDADSISESRGTGGDRSELASMSEPSGGAPSLTTAIKDDMRVRFERGERPTTAEYLERFPGQPLDSERVLSLLYEEFCLLEEVGESPDPEAFCERYEPWRTSLMSQLRYHEAFSRLAQTRPRPSFPSPGERFLWYQLDSQLGQGGAGRVFLARDETLGGKRIALKISLDQGDEPAIQGRLDHPHIVAVNRVEREPSTGLRGLSMPYWPGLPLDEVIRRIDPARTAPRSAKVIRDVLTTPEGQKDEELSAVWADFPSSRNYAYGVAWVALKLTRALAHAHGRDVLHRDIKPANILLTRRGGPLLLDFNLSQGAGTASEADQAARGGTLPYMAPEHLHAFLDPTRWDRLGPATDLYSLGLVIWEMLTGKRPPGPPRHVSTARMVNDLIEQRLYGPSLSARAENRHVPHALEAILQRCLAARFEQRYAHAEELIEDLERFLAHRPLWHARNPSYGERTRNWLWRSRVPIGCLVAGAVLAMPLSWLGAKVSALGNTVSILSPKASIGVAASAVSPATFVDNGSRYLEAVSRPENGGKLTPRDLRYIAAADKQYDLALQIQPDFYEALRGKGKVAFLRQDFVSGTRFLDRALTIASAQSAPAEKIAALLSDRGVYQTGQGFREQSAALGLEPQRLPPGLFDPVVSQKMRIVQSLHEAAVADLQRALRLTPEDRTEYPSLRTVELRLARSKIGMGDVANYFEDFQRAGENYKEAHGLLLRAMRRQDLSAQDEAECLALTAKLAYRNESVFSELASKGR